MPNTKRNSGPPLARIIFSLFLLVAMMATGLAAFVTFRSVVSHGWDHSGSDHISGDSIL